MVETTDITGGQRSDAGVYAFWTRDTVRFSDVDRYRHINNVAIATYCETGRVEFAERLWPGSTAGETAGWVIVKLTVAFLAQAHYPGEARNRHPRRAGRPDVGDDRPGLVQGRHLLCHQRGGARLGRPWKGRRTGAVSTGTRREATRGSNSTGAGRRNRVRSTPVRRAAARRCASASADVFAHRPGRVTRLAGTAQVLPGIVGRVAADVIDFRRRRLAAELADRLTFQLVLPQSQPRCRFVHAVVVTWTCRRHRPPSHPLPLNAGGINRLPRHFEKLCGETASATLPSSTSGSRQDQAQPERGNDRLHAVRRSQLGMPRFK